MGTTQRHVAVAAGVAGAVLLSTGTASAMPANAASVSAATASATSANAATAQAGPKVKITRVTKNFGSCHAAGAWLSSHAEAGRAHWHFTFRVKPPTVTEIRDEKHPGWDARTTGTAVYEPGMSSITLNIPHWSKMTKADVAAVRDYEEALLAHEEGHQRLAQDFLSVLKNIPVIALNKDKGTALRLLQRNVKTISAGIDDRLNKNEEEYDTKTANGVHQSAVGGKDVILTCR